MKITNAAAALLATVALAACGPNNTDQPVAEIVPKTTYQCEDGSVVDASYPTTDTAEVVIQGKSIKMTSVVSASGARYVGGGWKWWTKGLTEGMLAPLAEGETTTSGEWVSCTAS